MEGFPPGGGGDAFGLSCNNGRAFRRGFCPRTEFVAQWIRYGTKYDYYKGVPYSKIVGCESSREVRNLL